MPSQAELRRRWLAQQLEEWKDHFGRAAADNARLRARVEQLEETVRLLRLQLPLAHFMLPADPAGFDDRWQRPAIPEQRSGGHDAAAPTATAGQPVDEPGP